MKKLVMLIGALIVSTVGFASTQTTSSSALSGAWKAEQSMHVKPGQNDITMVYGGQDISDNPTLPEKTTTA